MATPPFDSCGFTLRIFHSWEWSRIDRELSGKIKKDINKKRAIVIALFFLNKLNYFFGVLSFSDISIEIAERSNLIFPA